MVWYFHHLLADHSSGMNAGGLGDARNYSVISEEGHVNVSTWPAKEGSVRLS